MLSIIVAPRCDCAGRRAARGFYFSCHKHCVFSLTLTRPCGLDQYHQTHTPVRSEAHVISWLPLCSPHLKYSKQLHFLILFYLFEADSKCNNKHCLMVLSGYRSKQEREGQQTPNVSKAGALSC